MLIQGFGPGKFNMKSDCHKVGVLKLEDSLKVILLSGMT